MTQAHLLTKPGRTASIQNLVEVCCMQHYVHFVKWAMRRRCKQLVDDNMWTREIFEHSNWFIQQKRYSYRKKNVSVSVINYLKVFLYSAITDYEKVQPVILERSITKYLFSFLQYITSVIAWTKTYFYFRMLQHNSRPDINITWKT